MTRSNPKSTFFTGMRHAVPFLLVLVPFAVLFGVVATEAGLNVVEVLGFSVAVIAGAAQFAAIQQINDAAPTIMVLATALAVNLRMAMYSASLTPHLGQASLWQRALVAYLMVDQVYILAIGKYESTPDIPLSEKLAYYFGIMAVLAPVWYSATLVGALAGRAIPPDLALDFALPITFLAMVAPMLRTVPHLAAAATSVLLALALAGLPYGAGLLVAAAAAMSVGALTELALERRRA